MNVFGARRVRAAVSLAAAALVTSAGLSVAHAEPPSLDPWFARDKALHFAASTVVGAGGYGLSSIFTDELAGRAAFGASLAIGVGIAKEAFDAAGYGDPSVRDFTWDLLGAATGVVVALTVNLAVEPKKVSVRAR